MIHSVGHASAPMTASVHVQKAVHSKEKSKRKRSPPPPPPRGRRRRERQGERSGRRHGPAVVIGGPDVKSAWGV